MNKKDWINIWLLIKDTYSKDKKRIVSMIVMSITKIISIYIGIFLLGNIVDCLYIGYSLEYFVQNVLLVFVIQYFCVVLSKLAQKYYDTKLDYSKDIETKYMNQKAMEFDYEYLEDSKISDLRYRSFGQSYYGITGWCLINVNNLLQGIFSIIITIILICPRLFTSTRFDGILGSQILSVVALLSVIVLTLINYKIGIHYTQLAKNEINSAESIYNRKQFYMNKFFDTECQKDIRLSKLQNIVLYDVKKMYNKLSDVEYRHGNLYLKRERFGGVLTGFNCILVYTVVGIRAVLGLLTAGNAIIVASSILQFSNQMLAFASTLGNMKSAALFAQDYFDFMNIENKKSVLTTNDNEHTRANNEIEFINVSFKYPNSNDYVLKNVNVTFECNKKIAIVGENGSGKTTLLKLLCGFYNDYEGEIYFNGTNFKEIEKKLLHERIAAVFQDFNILAFSIKDNFENNSEDEIQDALKEAGIKVASIDDNISKSIYFDGINFSGGEQQKIAIARAIAKDAEIVVMDEPTAALDPIAENEVFRGFDRLIKNCGGIFISHRLSSCKFCQKIIVMKQGNIVQVGNHNQLIKENGDYQLLWEAQKECYE